MESLMFSKAYSILEDIWHGIKVMMLDYYLIGPFTYWFVYLIITHTK